MLAAKVTRRLTLGAAMILVLVLAVPVGAAPPATMKVAKVTGTYEYFTFGEFPRTVSVSAHATDPVKGTWTWTLPVGTFSGPVTCLQVSGDDAWLAGPIWDWTGEPFWEGTGAVFMQVHDGGTPGRNGDTAFTWGTDPGQTLDEMEALCEEMVSPPWFGSGPFHVVSGNLNVWDAS